MQPRQALAHCVVDAAVCGPQLSFVRRSASAGPWASWGRAMRTAGHVHCPLLEIRISEQHEIVLQFHDHRLGWCQVSH